MSICVHLWLILIQQPVGRAGDVPFPMPIARKLMGAEMSKWVDRLERLWCARMHGRPMWPVRGRYQCPVCLREFPVQFEAVRQCERQVMAPRAVPREVSSY